MRQDVPLEVVYNLYSIGRNERVRLKFQSPKRRALRVLQAFWPTANWMEREVYDLFGVNFKNHPDLREYCCR